jgi:hypothetical protein
MADNSKCLGDCSGCELEICEAEPDSCYFGDAECDDEDCVCKCIDEGGDL